jgi:hypothetical protein
MYIFFIYKGHPNPALSRLLKKFVLRPRARHLGSIPLSVRAPEVSLLYLATNDQYGPVAGELLASVSFV